MVAPIPPRDLQRIYDRPLVRKARNWSGPLESYLIPVLCLGAALIFLRALPWIIVEMSK